ncbi:MAG: 4-(cytidine 5'-diphospho)-2-C-methyl-D-erythritol kinase [Coriobacteriia bacterium]|nr:4-(cytidine 5'-diphospho)-2-C-methyl-D-erythritol kinase [Coriobacteriia bacterium]
MARVTVAAHAKVNLHLAVGGTRPDGYHDVVTVLHTVDLADEVSAEPADSLSLVCEPDLGLPAEENLALRAAVAAGAALEREPALAIRLRKAIPARAGLGGGSADAAAVLRAAARLWEVDAGDPRIVGAARTLGADVPFLLMGGAALFSGRGDELVRLLPALSAPVVLAFPGEPVPTPAAYAAFDRLAHRDGRSPGARRSAEAMVAALEARDAAAVSRNLYNDLTAASVAVAPVVADVLEAVRSQPGVMGALPAGSGSAVFGITEDDEAAREAAGALRERGWWTRSARLSRGAPERIEEDLR